MNQAGNPDGPYDDDWCQDDQRLPPSLGVWPLGGTYVHSSDGALNTGGAGANGHGRPSANGHGGPAPAPGGRPALDRVDGGYRDDAWPAEPSFDADHIAAPPFTGAGGDGSTPLYERLALYERLRAPAPTDPAQPRRGRPPLYQVGGRYRGDDWPTDPGFRRGDLGQDESSDEPAPNLGAGGPDPSFGGPDPAYGEPRRHPSFGGPDPRYGDPRRDDSTGWPGAAYVERATSAVPGPYPPRGDGAGPGRGAGAAGHPQPRPASAPPSAQDPGAGMPARRAEPGERRRDPEPVTPIRAGTAGGMAPGRRGPETWERNVTPAARVAAVEDAKLLAFLHDLVQRLKAIPSLYPRLVFLVVGYAAITSLAAAYAEAIPLPITASLIVIPAAGIIFNMGMRYPDWGRRALVGWIAGIIATIVYDVLRLSLVKVGIWGDPIPGIGRLVLVDPHANFAWGYLWRFAGNGGGMGIAYTMLPWRGVRTGIAYGTLICTGLIALLFFFPVAQVHFFPLTPVTVAGGYAGHWVYGAVLGRITSWWLPPVELGRIHGRLTARLIHPGHRPRPSHARAAGGAGDPQRAAARRSAQEGGVQPAGR